MLKKDQMKRAMGTMQRRLGPLGLSLVAAALTATAFAGVSVAKDDGSADQDTLRAPGGPPHMFMERLSDEDRQALEEFRQCMEDNGAPAPPAPPKPGSIEPGDAPAPPEPPSEADREAIEKALETCEEKAFEGAHGFGPGAPGGPPCGPPPGAPPNDEQQAAPQQGSSSSTS